MNNQIISVGLEGMRGYPVVSEANVRDEKEACVIRAGTRYTHNSDTIQAINSTGLLGLEM